MDVLSVCKDPGGVKNVLPVFRKLRRSHQYIEVVAEGAAVSMLQKMGQPFRFFPSATSLVENMEYADMLVTGMSSEGGIGRDLVRDGGMRVVCVQDFWGAQLLSSWSSESCRPTRICVNDTFAKEVVLAAWPGYPDKQIIVTGYPDLDRLYGQDASKMGILGREKLSVSALGLRLIVFSGQVKQSGAVLQEVVAAANQLTEQAHLIALEHPRMRADAPEEVEAWEQAIGSYRRGDVLTDISGVSFDEILAAADVVVSIFGGALTSAVTLRRPGIAVLYPDVGMAKFLEQTGGVMDEFPLVSLGCVAKAVDRASLLDQLRLGIRGELDQQAAQEKHFTIDGGNAGRVANVVESLL